jgi:hypothetical protein
LWNTRGECERSRSYAAVMNDGRAVRQQRGHWHKIAGCQV